MPEAPTPRQTLAMLFGASTYPRSPALTQGPIFTDSARDVQEYLTSPGGLALPFENVRWLFDDPRSPSEQMQDFRNFLETRTIDLLHAGTPAQDLIIYYVGHGGFSGSGHDYCLAVSTTDDKLKGPTSVRGEDLAAVIKQFAPFLRRFLILDCCFAGSAFQLFQADPMEVGREKILAELPGRGTALLCSSSAQDPSLAPQGHSRTLFTDALLHSLWEGHPLLRSTFSFGELGDLVKARIRETSSELGPRPEVHSPDQREGDVATIPFFANPARSSARQAGRTLDAETRTQPGSGIQSQLVEIGVQSATDGNAMIEDSKASEARTAEFRRFLSRVVFEVDADAMHGLLTKPFEQQIGRQISTRLFQRGGYISQIGKEFRVENLVSYKSARTEGFGELTGTEKYFRAMATVESLNIWEVITVDRIVSTLEVDLSRLDEALPTVEFLGTRIENLRVGGFAIDVTLDASFLELVPAAAGFSLRRNGKEVQTRGNPYFQVRAPHSESFQQISSNTIELRGGGRLVIGELKIANKSLSSTLLRYENERMGTVSVANTRWAIEECEDE